MSNFLSPINFIVGYSLMQWLFVQMDFIKLHSMVIYYVDTKQNAVVVVKINGAVHNTQPMNGG